MRRGVSAGIALEDGFAAIVGVWPDPPLVEGVPGAERRFGFCPQTASKRFLTTFRFFETACTMFSSTSFI